MSDDLEARMRLVANEQTKLTATLLDNLASGAALAGAIGPMASSLYTRQIPQSPYWGAFVVFWLMISAGAHTLAQLKLRRLTP